MNPLDIPLAWRLTEAVAERLGVVVDPAVRQAQLKRLPEGIRDAAAVRDDVLQCTGAVAVAMLDRPVSGEEFADVARAGALPAVILRQRGDEVEALVAESLAGTDVQVQVLPARGLASHLRMTRAAFTALGDDPSTRALLVPIDVTPSISAGHGGQPGDGHEHPTPWQRLVQLLLRERREVLLALFYATVSGVVSLVLPLTVQAVTTLAFNRQVVQPAVLLIAFIVAGTALAGVLAIVQQHAVEVIQQRVFARMGLEFAFRLPRISYERAAREDLPEQMNRFFEVVTIQKSVSKLLTDSTTALLQVFFGLLLLTAYHPAFTLFGLGLLAALALVFWWTGPRGLRTAVDESKYKYRVVHWLEEMARTLGTLKFAGRSNLAVDRMDHEVSGYLTYRQAHFRVLVQQSVAIVAIKVVVTASLLLVGMVLVSREQISVGQFVAAELVIVNVLAGVEKLIGALPTVYDLLVAVEKAGHVTDGALEESAGYPLPEHASEPGVAVTTRALGYRYPGADEWALQDVSLAIDGGAVVAITGLEGSGQSTLLKVLAGLLPSYHGAVALNGFSLRDLDGQAMREQVGGILAPGDLFEGTLEENVAMGRPGVRAAQVVEALERVGLGEAVQLLPEGLDTPIRLGGREFPMSLVRKLQLARAIVARPKLVLVDDFFEHLEPGYRREVIRLLSDEGGDWTVIAATHDPMFLSACDWIYVMEGGRIVIDGPYDELLEDARFRAIVSQSLEPRPGGRR